MSGLFSLILYNVVALMSHETVASKERITVFALVWENWSYNKYSEVLRTQTKVIKTIKFQSFSGAKCVNLSELSDDWRSNFSRVRVRISSPWKFPSVCSGMVLRYECTIQTLIKRL